MQTLFKLTYSLVVAILFILLVILGIRAFYDEPEEPSHPIRTVPIDAIDVEVPPRVRGSRSSVIRTGAVSRETES